MQNHAFVLSTGTKGIPKLLVQGVSLVAFNTESCSLPAWASYRDPARPKPSRSLKVIQCRILNTGAEYLVSPACLQIELFAVRLVAMSEIVLTTLNAKYIH